MCLFVGLIAELSFAAVVGLVAVFGLVAILAIVELPTAATDCY